MLKKLLENELREVLLDSGIFSSQIDEDLINAVQASDSKKVRELLDSSFANVNAEGHHGETPLLMAVQVKNFDLVKELLKRGAKVNTVTLLLGSRRSPLMVAIIHVLHLDIKIIKLLLKNGADVNERFGGGKTLLMYLLKEKPEIGMIKLLLKHGADVTPVNQNFSALHYAIEKENDIDIIKLLLKYTDQKQIDEGLVKAISLKKSDEIIKTLVDGSTTEMLHLAVKMNRLEVVVDLIEHDADVNTRDSNKQTPLMVAILERKPNIDIIKFLLKHGADINIKDKSGKSAWQMAVKKRDKELMKILIKRY